jgi:glycosyltransferase involved in cell wall biosynthesis
MHKSDLNMSEEFNRIDISFVIPVRNGAKTIEQCLESLLSQKTELIFEIIVVDNNSTDETLDRIKGYQLKIINEKNVGRSHARNRGLLSARGEWIAFVDCDVVLDELWLENMNQSIIKNSIDAAQGVIIPHGPFSSFQSYRKSLIFNQTQGSYCQLDTTTFIYPLINSAACLYRKDILLEVKGFDPFMKGYEDADLSWRAWLKGAIYGVVPDARAYVYWDRGGFLSYLWRYLKMGRELKRLYLLWNIKITPLLFDEHLRFSARWHRFIESLRSAIFKTSFNCSNPLKMHQDDFCRQRQFIHFQYKKFLMKDEKTLICLGPTVRMVWTKKSLVFKDYASMKKVCCPRLTDRMDREDLEQIIEQNLKILQQEKMLWPLTGK